MKKLIVLTALAGTILAQDTITLPVASKKEADGLLGTLLIYTTSDMRLLHYRAEFNSDKIEKVKDIASRFNAAAEHCKQATNDNASVSIEQHVAQCLTKESLKSDELHLISEAVRIEDTALNMSRQARYFLQRVAEHATVIEKEQQKQEQLNVARKALKRAHRRAYHSFYTV